VLSLLYVSQIVHAAHLGVRDIGRDQDRDDVPLDLLLRYRLRRRIDRVVGRLVSLGIYQSSAIHFNNTNSTADVPLTACAYSSSPRSPFSNRRRGKGELGVVSREREGCGCWPCDNAGKLWPVGYLDPKTFAAREPLRELYRIEPLRLYWKDPRFWYQLTVVMGLEGGLGKEVGKGSWGGKFGREVWDRGSWAANVGGERVNHEFVCFQRLSFR
jgi:hypothetical protein